MINKIFNWFESRVEAYPEAVPLSPKKGLLPFVWSGMDGVRKWIAVLAVMTAGIGIMEALLFQFMGKVVDWLGRYTPETLFAEKGWALAGMALMMLFSICWIFIASNVRLQTLQGVFPMRLRWNFHRLMLGQSLGFYQDEFAGRVSAKVMQTALSLRDVVMTLADMVTYVLVYFITSGVILATLDSWLLLPFIGWIIGFALVMRFLIPKLGRTAAAQADARSLMTGRITDAYSNITTVKLFSHGAREAAYAKQSMEEFMVTVHAQMRLATMLHTCSFLVNTSLTLSTAALGIWLWHQGQVGVGAVATATAMALRVNGLSQYIMWESARLFENIGTVSDGMATLSKPQTILDKPNAPPLKVVRGEIKFDKVDFSYEAGKPLLQDFNLTIRPGEKVGLIGRSGAGKSTIVNLLLRFYEPQNGTISIDGQNVGDVTQESLRAQIGLVTQDTSLLHRSVRDNIVYGRPEATDEEMFQAAKRAEAADFIPNLSDAKGRTGYDAHVGERGVKLSGGQRQRLALARALAQDTQILILTEPLNSVDEPSQKYIYDRLEECVGTPVAPELYPGLLAGFETIYVISTTAEVSRRIARDNNIETQRVNHV